MNVFYENSISSRCEGHSLVDWTDTWCCLIAWLVGRSSLVCVCLWVCCLCVCLEYLFVSLCGLVVAMCVGVCWGVILVVLGFSRFPFFLLNIKDTQLSCVFEGKKNSISSSYNNTKILLCALQGTRKLLRVGSGEHQTQWQQSCLGLNSHNCHKIVQKGFTSPNKDKK